MLSCNGQDSQRKWSEFSKHVQVIMRSIKHLSCSTLQISVHGHDALAAKGDKDPL